MTTYGHLSPDGREYVITDPRTPRPWVNVVANPRAGFVVSQTGSGFSFLENSQLAVVTRWQQDLVEDVSGKFLYVRDAGNGDVWSLSPAPCWAPFDSFVCRHGLGYTAFGTSHAGIEAEWTLFCHAEETVEIWRVTLRNASDRPRTLRLWGFLEWCCGVAPAPRREFGKLFLETRFDAPRGAIVARSHMWDVPSARFGHWNTSFPYASAFATSGAVVSAQGDKEGFLGRYGGLRAPAALFGKGGEPAFGRHEDPIAALEVEVVLAPGEARTLGFALGSAESDDAAAALAARFARDERERSRARGGDRRLARAARRAPDGDTRPHVRCARERLDALPGDLRAALGALRLLPAERRVRLPRPAPGLAGLPDDRPRALPRPDPAARGPPVRGRVRPALVAPAHGAGPRHEDDGRPPVARVRRGELREGDGRVLRPRRRGAIPRR